MCSFVVLVTLIGFFYGGLEKMCQINTYNCCVYLVEENKFFLLQEEQQMRPQFYSFRWLTLLLSQEFALPGEQL